MHLTNDEVNKLKDTVERIPQFEDKIGVKIENISFSITNPYFNLHGDIFMDDLSNFDNYSSIEVWGTIYNKDNNILASQRAYIDKNSFLGFETFTIHFFNDNIKVDSINKIRVYIKAIPVISWD